MHWQNRSGKLPVAGPDRLFLPRTFQPMHTDFPNQVLTQHLHRLLSDIDAEAINLLRSRLQWVEIAAGETLMHQGDPGDSMYLSISGRLRALVRDDDGVERVVRELGRGEVIGEMSLYTGCLLYTSRCV